MARILFVMVMPMALTTVPTPPTELHGQMLSLVLIVLMCIRSSSTDRYISLVLVVETTGIKPPPLQVHGQQEFGLQ